MSDALLIGIDIGTRGVKGALFSATGKCVASSFRASKLRQPRPGEVEEDPEYQVAGVCAVIRDCLKKSRAAKDQVAALAIAGQMAGVIGIGPDGRAVTPYDSWLDTRCSPQIEQMRRKAGKEIICQTGGPASFNHGPKILWWKKERPAVYRKIVSFVQPGGYAAMRLCGLEGKDAFIDASYLHFSGFADNRRLQWDENLCRTFAVNRSKLPSIVASHQVVGGVSRAMAARCGLKPGVTVVAGCGDTTSSFLACGATRKGVCVDVAGTASVFAATTGRYRPDMKFQTLSYGRSVIPGLWHPYAYINGGGMNLEWFRQEFHGGKRLEDLDKTAEQIQPNASLPYFVPHVSGRVSPSWPHLRGAWAGLSWSHGAAHLYRSMLEGVALEYGIYRNVLRALDSRFEMKEVRVTGGGGRSKTWNVIKAGVLGCPIVQMAGNEGAPMGAALLAGFGAGVLRDMDRAAKAWTHRGIVTKPRHADLRVYSHRLRQYEQLLTQLHPWNLS